jgi:hypothetical protein
MERPGVEDAPASSTSQKTTDLVRAGPRHVDVPGRLLIWRPFKPIFFKYLFNMYLALAGKSVFY